MTRLRKTFRRSSRASGLKCRLSRFTALTPALGNFFRGATIARDFSRKSGSLSIARQEPGLSSAKAYASKLKSDS